MKTYEEMAQSALVRGKAMRKKRKKTNMILFGSLAVCCVVILLILGFGRSSNGTTPNDPHTPPIQAAQPRNLRFDSINQLQELVALADEDQETLDDWFSGNGYYFDARFYTPERIQEFRTLLSSLELPCREDYDGTFDAMYYYPDRGLIEIFYDVDGIRYWFLCNSSSSWRPDGIRATPVTLDGASAKLREGSYGDSRRLFATFCVNEQEIAMCAFTTDPDKVDLTGFYWGNILTDPNASER